MKALIKKCPSCHHDLTVAVLHCPECGLELKNDFEMSPFDKLNDEQADFLTAFLRNRGNLKNLQAELQISYPYAKKKLDNVLAALGIAAEEAEAKLAQAGSAPAKTEEAATEEATPENVDKNEEA